MSSNLRADLNVTPLIDVLLVLLVIFMAALPLTQKGIDTQLPSHTQPPDAPRSRTAIVLEYTADGRLSINQQDVLTSQLESKLRDIYQQRQDKTMFLMGAGTLRYKAIIEIIDAAKGAGVERVGIVTERMRHAAATTRVGD